MYDNFYCFTENNQQTLQSGSGTKVEIEFLSELNKSTDNQCFPSIIDLQFLITPSVSANLS